MQSNRDLTFEELSPWWEHAVVLVMALGFSLLIWRSVQTYTDAPPIPLRATTSNGEVVYTREDIVGGQNVFMKFGLMDNGTIGEHMWGQTFQPTICTVYPATWLEPESHLRKFSVY